MHMLAADRETWERYVSVPAWEVESDDRPMSKRVVLPELKALEREAEGGRAMTKTERDLLVAIGETLSAFASWARSEHEHNRAFRKTTRELNAALIAVAEETTATRRPKPSGKPIDVRCFCSREPKTVCDYCQAANEVEPCPT
jgi:hypothetical protein